MPPEEIWLDDEALAAHFDAVKRSMRSGSNDGTWEDIASEEQNELTRGLRRG